MADSIFLSKLKEMNWPQEFREKLKIGNLNSNVGIATLWSYQDVVAKNLDINSYCVIGNFYDKQNGLEPLIRNCLANPNLRYIVLVGNDKSGSKETLVNFFEKGFKDGLVVDTKVKLPKTIPLEELESLRANVKLIDLTSFIKNFNDSEEYATIIIGAINQLEKKQPYSEPKIYLKEDLDIDTFPSEGAGYIVRDRTIGSAWLKILKTVMDYGTKTKLRSNNSTYVKECINLMTVIDDEDPDRPELNEYFRFNKDYLFKYYKEICTDKLPEGVNYTYGSRFRSWKTHYGKIDQIQDLIDYLKKDLCQRSALALTWVVDEELIRKSKESPCIILVHVIVRDGKLYLTSYIRSNDMFRGWPLNAFGLRKLQKIIANELDLELGQLITISSSAHIYDENWSESKEIIEKYYKGTNCFFDPRGYFIIRTLKDKINVQYRSPDGKLLKEYNETSTRIITDQINSSQHPVDPYHSAYLGEELMKAEIALKQGLVYEQDKELDFSKHI